MYQKKIAYGSHGFPWTFKESRNDISYKKGICPNAEELHDKTFIGFDICMYELSDVDIDLIVSSFQKVWRNIRELRQ